jgi:hypothetical protein
MGPNNCAMACSATRPSERNPAATWAVWVAPLAGLGGDKDISGQKVKGEILIYNLRFEAKLLPKTDTLQKIYKQ